MEFSIVITTYGRPHKVAQCLTALARLDFPRSEYEVIVIDDGSPEPLDAIIEPFLAGGNVRLYRQANQGASAGRNYGAQLARGRYVAFTDDDCEPAADWLTQLSGATRKYPEAMIGGHTVNRLKQDLCATASQELLNAVYDYYNAEPCQARFFATCNVCLPREDFLSMGGLNRVFRYGGEDRDLCERWLDSGRRMIYVPEAIALHSHGMSLRAYWRQQMAYGRGAALLARARATVGREAMDKAGTFQSRLPVWLWKAMNTQRAIRHKLAVGALIIMAQFAVAVGFALETRKLAREGWPGIPSPLPLDPHPQGLLQ